MQVYKEYNIHMHCIQSLIKVWVYGRMLYFQVLARAITPCHYQLIEWSLNPSCIQQFAKDNILLENFARLPRSMITHNYLKSLL